MDLLYDMYYDGKMSQSEWNEIMYFDCVVRNMTYNDLLAYEII